MGECNALSISALLFVVIFMTPKPSKKKEEERTNKLRVIVCGELLEACVFV
jgi:hypothetical protein